MEIDQVTKAVIGAAIEVQRNFEPGLLESAYQLCIARELALRNIPFEQQKPIMIEYKGIDRDGGYRLDFLVDQKVVGEIKAVENILPIHEAHSLPIYYLPVTR